MKKRLFALAISVSITACTAVKENISMLTAVKVERFNSAGDKYYEKPASAFMKPLTDGSAEYFIGYDTYGGGFEQVAFNSRNTDQYSQFIDKYLEWEKIATKDGDLLEKAIGDTKSTYNGMSATLNFSIFSANQNTHYLVIKSCVIGSCTDSITLDRTNAIVLRAELVKLGSGELLKRPDESKYR